MRGGGAGDEDAIAAADRAAVAGHRLPRRAALAAAVGRDFVGRRKFLDVVAQVARRGEERRLAIFVAAVAGDSFEGGLRQRDRAPVVVVEPEGKDARVIGDVLRFAEARADDDAGYRGLVEDGAAGDVG